MNESGDSLDGLEDSGRERALRRSRVRKAGSAAVAVITIDIFVLIWVVPWADELTDNPFMSWGYIVTFFLTFVNFLFFLGLMAYLAHQDSYPSDRWK